LIYFDNSATTKVNKVVIEKMSYIMENEFGNPSSLHNFGFSAEKEINKAKIIIAKIINSSEDEIYFTSGGTEANNTAILGIINAHKKMGDHIVVSKIEHPSVIEVYKNLEKMGYSVSYINTDKKGYINISELENSITEKTILVSIMHINNEIGTVQNIKEIFKAIKNKNKKTYLHTDCVQSFCKYKINSKYADLITLSGHKIHGPKGIGALFIRKGVRINPILFGGKQQNGIRPGTENVPGIIGFSLAADIMSREMLINNEKVSLVKNKLMEITNMLPDIYINGDKENGSPYILNMSFKDIKGEVLLHSLEERGIYVSTGSACTSRHKKHIGTVNIIGGLGENSIRFSFSNENTEKEAELCLSELFEIIPILRQYVRRP